MKALFAILLTAALSWPALADPFDQKLCTTVSDADGKVSDGCVTNYGLELGELQFTRAAGMKVMAIASNQKTGVGPLTLTMQEYVTDAATGKTTDSGPLTFAGLKLGGVMKIMRAQHQMGDTLMRVAEGMGDAGKPGANGKAWGRNKRRDK